MKEVKYNPFGSTENEYSYNAIYKKREKKTPWVSIAIIMTVSLIVIAYAVTFMSAQQIKKDADQAIDDFNSSLASVHETFSDPMLPQELRDIADETEDQLGGETEAIRATRILANVIGHFEDSAPVFDKEGEREQEAVKVAPYYAACDISSYALDGKAFDYRSMCGEFTDVAYTMMKKVRIYNEMANGFLGTITFHNDEYVDIMNRPGENPGATGNDEDVPVEGGNLPPQE